MSMLVLASICVSITLIIYHHIGYPLILRGFRTLNSPQQIDRLSSNHYQYNSSREDNTDETQDSYHSITIVVPAFNEQRYISEKLHNLACMDYPTEKMKIIVACDGCTDNTVSIAEITAKNLSTININVINFAKNRGKCSVLNEVVPTVDTDIVAFSDVSSIVSVDALKICDMRFRTQQTGGINGNYRILNPTNAGEQKYWQYQRNIKLGEQSLGSLLGAHGAFYAIRTNLFKILPKDTINDDFIIPMRVIEQGYSVVYDHRINALELESTSDEANWQRRKRIGFGNTQQLVALKNLLHPKYKGVAFAFLSGKVLRVLMPFLMIYTFFASLYCSMVWPIFIPVFLAQVAIYLVALNVEMFKSKKVGKTAKTIHYLITGHAANFFGSLNYLTRSKSHW